MFNADRRKKVLFHLIYVLLTANIIVGCGKANISENTSKNPNPQTSSTNPSTSQTSNDEPAVVEPTVDQPTKTKPVIENNKASLPPPAAISEVFPDPFLAEVIATLLKKNVTDIVTKEDLASYKGELSCPPGDMSNLSGIGYLTGITSLSCCKNAVSKLPPEIGNLVNLKSINFVKAYSLKVIPPEIGKLKKLEYANFGLTEVASIPKEIGNLTNLKVLLLGTTQIKSIPEEIGNLKTLQCLDIHSNQIPEVPDTLSNLTELKQLDLSHNKLTSLPQNLGNLSKLRYLNLFNNDIKRLPESMSKLTYLDSLNVFDNMSLSESYKTFMPKISKVETTVLLNSDCVLDAPSGLDLNGYGVINEFRAADSQYNNYSEYIKIIPAQSNSKLILDKNLFTEQGEYEFRIIVRNEVQPSLYKVYIWNITTK